MEDQVNPDHYKGDRVMEVIEDFSLNFALGNVIKYVLRHEEKGGLTDLKKAFWYLEREIARQTKADAQSNRGDLKARM